VRGCARFKGGASPRSQWKGPLYFLQPYVALILPSLSTPYLARAAIVFTSENQDSGGSSAKAWYQTWLRDTWLLPVAASSYVHHRRTNGSRTHNIKPNATLNPHILENRFNKHVEPRLLPRRSSVPTTKVRCFLPQIDNSHLCRKVMHIWFFSQYPKHLTWWKMLTPFSQLRPPRRPRLRSTTIWRSTTTATNVLRSSARTVSTGPATQTEEGQGLFDSLVSWYRTQLKNKELQLTED